MLLPRPAASKIPAPSRKNVRFSGKKRGKRVRFTWRSSASVSAKSVFTVSEAVRFGRDVHEDVAAGLALSPLPSVSPPER